MERRVLSRLELRNFKVLYKYVSLFQNFLMRGVPVMAQWKRIRLVSTRTQVRSLVSLSGLGIRRCRELWCRVEVEAWILHCYGGGVGRQLQLWLDPILEPPGAAGTALKRQKKKKKKKRKKETKKSGAYLTIYGLSQLTLLVTHETRAWGTIDSVGELQRLICNPFL